MSRSLRLGAVVLALSTVVTPAADAPRVPAAVVGAIEQITAAELRAHVEALAADDMSGRVVGHEGNRKAVAYAARVLRSAGVAPAAASYLQDVELYHASLRDDSRLTIAQADGQVVADLPAGAQFHPLPESSALDVSGPLVFAGHGLTARTLRHDDYARRDVKGAIVLVEEGVPAWIGRRPSVTPDQVAELSTVERKIADAHARGAVGVIVIEMSAADARTVWTAPTSPRATAYRLHSALLTRPVAAAVLSGHAAGPIRRALSDGRPLVATLRPGIAIHRLTVHNVVASLEPAANGPGGTVVVGAHLDHEGVDDEGRVFNGADDNASGTAAVLAIAAALSKAADRGQRPRRRVVFALWNAEERGSLGAEAYAASPVPAGRIIANLNLDMIGRAEDVPDPDDPKLRGFRRTSARQNRNVVHLLGYSLSPDLAAAATRANERVGLTLKREYDEDAQGLLKRSDHWVFLKRGIPALFFTTGLHPDYHTPRDDAERLDFTKLERIAELVGRLAWMVAEGEPPHYRGNR